MKLWTADPLEAAARLYLEVGFPCTERNSVRQWGHRPDELRYDLELR
ncbi:hypothetical protein BJ970_001581 [Saccharopolyspora phatthalungensis]|uniref:Acetyltransferase n=1 Tax=Saccharopolyspora phatthalungensis TaxID=664693 RepID=A0A840Q221_9PSEU|nr:hypothetical protein [Saccharopolyspora phatthalungensis]